ncbi:MAG: ribosomal RNA small subunit methyltransferase A [Bdellovibrionales bacterium]|nr:ribosomal RNA small subunit methyltransferase A [Bdellovibrionales bacterium]
MPFDKRKAFGQHFLHDQSVISKIVQAVAEATQRHPECSVLEIGPGEGAITRPLLQALPIEKKFYIAERDRELIELWKGESRVEKILEGDFARVEDATFLGFGPLIVVSNLPYSAGTAITVSLCERSKQIPEMVLMFQAEVAKRLYAEPSTPDRGSLSLYIQNEWDVERLIEVKPGAFKPPPKVMSEVVTLTRRDKTRVDVSLPELRDRFSELLKKSFAHRRKMLRGNLSAEPYKSALARSGVDPTLRAESLTWDDWTKLWSQL